MVNGTTEAERRNALLQAEALQQAIITSSTFAIITTDAEGIIQVFNAGAERMLGYCAAEVVNKIKPSDMHDPQEVAAHALALSREFATNIAPGFEALAYKASRSIDDVYELTHIRKDGSRFPGLNSITSLRDDHGDVIGYLLIGTDNTVHKKAEGARQTSDARLNGLITSVLDAIIAVDANHRIILFNPAAERMFGVIGSAVLGSSLDRFIPSRFRSTHSEKIQRFGATKKSARSMGNVGEIFGLHSDGTEFPIDASIAHHVVNGETMFTVVLRDVSERERLYQMLKERNVAIERAGSIAEKANSEKSKFLANMSHELRTPLNAILGFAQLMESDSPARTPSDKRSVGQILKAGWYLLELINEILDLALIESGKTTMSREPVSLAAVMLECQAMVEAEAKKRGLGITFPRIDIPYVVNADRTRLKQILVNFLTNAIKYNKRGGTVSVECAPSPPDSIRISVRDTGEGMSPEQLARLFEPFNRLGKEGGVVEGTGIGLVVAKRLIELLGGTIGVESIVGVGSVFWIEMRLTIATQLATQNTGSAALAGPQETGSAPQRTLLYVEDNPANLQLVEEIIARRPDLRLLSAADGSLGIEFALAYQPDVILMDINLPGINGIDAMKILRADPSTAHIPIVALSANAMPHDVKKALAAGFFNYLTKPIQVNQLLQELDVALNFAQTTPRRSGKNKQETSL